MPIRLLQNKVVKYYKRIGLIFLLTLLGKSLICKEVAIRTKKLCANEVYYVSLLASNSDGTPRNQYYTFDEASKIDLAGTGVKVLDVYQLWAKYMLRHPDISEEDSEALTVYDLANDLIDADPNASFFFDECPFIGVLTKWYEVGCKLKFLMKNRSIAKN